MSGPNRTAPERAVATSAIRLMQGEIFNFVFKCLDTADTYTNNHWWAWIAACMLNNIQNSLLNTLYAISRHQHLDAALVLGTKALAGQLDSQLITRNNLGIDNSRSIVPAASPSS